MDVRKYNRRAHKLLWAEEYHQRAIEAGNAHRARRGTTMMYALDGWLNKNSDATSYSEHE
jgi:hypothetical protein